MDLGGTRSGQDAGGLRNLTETAARQVGRTSVDGHSRERQEYRQQRPLEEATRSQASAGCSATGQSEMRTEWSVAHPPHVMPRLDRGISTGRRAHEAAVRADCPFKLLLNGAANKKDRSKRVTLIISDIFIIIQIKT